MGCGCSSDVGNTLSSQFGTTGVQKWDEVKLIILQSSFKVALLL